MNATCCFHLNAEMAMYILNSLKKAEKEATLD